MLRRYPLKRKTPLKVKAPMKKKRARHAPTKKEEDHHDRIRAMQCCVSSRFRHECRGATTVSHFNGLKYKGMGQRSNHYLVIPICYGHHIEGPNSIPGIGGFKSWTAKYGEQEKLLERVWAEFHARYPGIYGQQVGELK